MQKTVRLSVKLLSVFCTLALILSVCAVPFGATAEDTGVITIDFENDSYTDGTEIATITTYTGVNGNAGNKAFMGKGATSTSYAIGNTIKNKNEEYYSFKAGVYQITWDYLITGVLQPANKMYLVNEFPGNTGSTTAADATIIAGAEFDLLPNKTTLNIWQQGDVTVNITEDVTQLGLFVVALAATAYVDNIVITPVEKLVNDNLPTSLNIDFSTQAECDQGSSIYKVDEHISDDQHGKALGVVFGTGYDGGYKYCEIKENSTSCGDGVACNHSTDGSAPIKLAAGTYKVTYDYYYKDAPGYCSEEAPNYNGSYVRPDAFAFKFAYARSEALAWSINNVLGNNIIDTGKAQKTWHKGQMLLTFTGDVNHLGFYLINSPYHIYLDNISFELVELGEKTVIDFEKGEKPEFTTSYATIGAVDNTTNKAFIGNTSNVLSSATTTYYPDNYPRGTNILKADGSAYSLSAGSYRVTWDYKLTGALNAADTVRLSDSIANASTDGTVLIEDMVPQKANVGMWQKGEKTIVLTQDAAKLGIFCRPLFSTVYIDNIEITPIEADYAKVAGYDLFVNATEETLADTKGTQMAPTSVIYTKDDGSERTAFRFVSSFNYIKDGDALYLDEAKTLKVLKRGMKFGVVTDNRGTHYQQKADSLVDASAAAWSDDGSTKEYTFKVYNISVSNKDQVYFVTPYLVVEMDGEQFTITGKTKETSVQGIYDASNAKTNNYDWYTVQ